MKTKKFYIFLLVFVILPIVSFGQTANDVLKKMNNNFIASKAIQFQTKYNLYKDHNTKTITESYNGLFIKNASNDVYMKIDNTEFINTSKSSLKVNHKEKAMMISDGQKFSTGEFDINKLLEYSKINSFKDYSSYWEIILVPKEFSGLNYSKIILNIAKNYLIQKQVFFYNTNMDFSKNYRKQELSTPRLEILYSNYTYTNTHSAKINTAKFFIVNKENKVLATSAYKSYEVNDNRNIQRTK